MYKQSFCSTVFGMQHCVLFSKSLGFCSRMNDLTRGRKHEMAICLQLQLYAVVRAPLLLLSSLVFHFRGSLFPSHQSGYTGQSSLLLRLSRKEEEGQCSRPPSSFLETLGISYCAVSIPPLGHLYTVLAHPVRFYLFCTEVATEHGQLLYSIQEMASYLIQERALSCNSELQFDL